MKKLNQIYFVPTSICIMTYVVYKMDILLYTVSVK
jgi:hypothetical protein